MTDFTYGDFVDAFRDFNEMASKGKAKEAMDPLAFVWLNTKGLTTVEKLNGQWCMNRASEIVLGLRKPILWEKS